MYLSPVLDPSGRPVFSVGGKQAWKTFAYRGLNVSLEWVVSETRQRAAPCLCIWKDTPIFAMSATGGSENGIWAIGRTAITDFVGFNKDNRCTGGPSHFCMREAQAALPILGFDRNDVNAFKALVDCVVKFAPELVLMPPTPISLQREANPRAMWEVKATNKASGKTLSHEEI